MKPGGLVEPGVVNYGKKIDIDMKEVERLRNKALPWTTKQIAKEFNIGVSTLEKKIREADLESQVKGKKVSPARLKALDKEYDKCKEALKETEEMKVLPEKRLKWYTYGYNRA